MKTIIYNYDLNTANNTLYGADRIEENEHFSKNIITADAKNGGIEFKLEDGTLFTIKMDFKAAKKFAQKIEEDIKYYSKVVETEEVKEQKNVVTIDTLEKLIEDEGDYAKFAFINFSLDKSVWYNIYKLGGATKVNSVWAYTPNILLEELNKNGIQYTIAQ